MKWIAAVFGITVLSGLALWHPAPAPQRPTIYSAASALPAASVRVHRSAATPGNVVYVTGAVARPGLYRVPDGARAADAVRQAGGLRENADAEEVNLAARVEDGDEVRVPRAGEAISQRTHRSSHRKHRRRRSHVNLNTADVSALASLPGVGEDLARRIVVFRSLNGPFASLDELADVAGMTQRRVDAATPYLILHEAR